MWRILFVKETLMRNLIKVFGLIALVAIIGFSMAACPDDGNGGGGGGGGGGGDVTPIVAGTFEYEGREAKFYAGYASGGRSVSRAAGMPANEKELSGKIEDGKIIFNLKGFYNTADNKFYLSAGSGTQIYLIAGILFEGIMTETQANVKVISDDDWIVYTAEVKKSNDVSISGPASKTQVDGLPSKWFGNWTNKDGNEPDRYFTLSAWHYIDSDKPENPEGLIDIVPLANGRFETIWHAYVYMRINEGPKQLIGKTFIKLWIEESGQDLLFTGFIDSTSPYYSDAKAYNTATPGRKEEATLVRVSP
jgi:hypothetical protein